MGKLVDQGDIRPARQDGIGVHLFDDHTAVGHPQPRDDLELADLGLGLGPAVRLDEPDARPAAARCRASLSIA